MIAESLFSVNLIAATIACNFAPSNPTPTPTYHLRP
jgi:hypothetical protein